MPTCRCSYQSTNRTSLGERYPSVSVEPFAGCPQARIVTDRRSAAFRRSRVQPAQECSLHRARQTNAAGPALFLAVLLLNLPDRIIWNTVRRTRPLSTTRSNTRCISSVSRTDTRPAMRAAILHERLLTSVQPASPVLVVVDFVDQLQTSSAASQPCCERYRSTRSGNEPACFGSSL